MKYGLSLWGNCSFNPVSALTNKTLDQIGSDKELHIISVRIVNGRMSASR